MNFKFLREKKLRTTTYWKGDEQFTILIPEDIICDYEIGYYVRGWTDAHHDLPKHPPIRFAMQRNYFVYGLGYRNYQLTQQELEIRNEII